MSNDLTAQAVKSMQFDSLAAAERLTGVSYKNDEATVGLGMLLHMANSEQKRRLLGELCDTHYDITWAEFLQIITKYGFEIVDQWHFAYENKRPTAIVAAHRAKKLLLFATSFVWPNKEVVNDGTVYGSFAFSEDEPWRNVLPLLSGCSHGPGAKGQRHFSKDAREGLITTLEGINETHAFVDWNDPGRFLWLLPYGEQSESWQEAKARFLEKAPEWVRAFIVGHIDD